ncbi:DMT family transporter [Kitasatospora sp. NPDC056184]|uniref:DMT family transporter n=1 Tax=Kitasatospora sp. NPDC056184 TaxID=3345738 RepID=UPI0035D7FA8B
MPNRASTPASPSVCAPAPASPAVGARRPGALAGPLPVLAAAVLWGTTGTAGSLAPAGAPAAAIGCAGLVLGGLLLLLSDRTAHSLPRTCTPRERRLLLLGALAVAGYPLTFYPAVARTGVAVATVIALGSAPVLTGLLAWLTGGPRPTARWACATATAVLGCALLVLGPRLGGGATPTDLAGVLLAALAGLSYAAYSLVGGRLIARGHPSAGVMGAMFGAAAVLVLPVLLIGDPHWLAAPRGLLVVLHLGVVTTFLAYRLFGRGLRHTSAQTATALTLAEPAVAAVLGVTALGERLPAASWSGLAVLTLALAVLTAPLPRRR